MAPMFHLLLHVLLSIFSSTFAQNKLKIDSPSTAFAYRRWVNTRPPSGNELTYTDGTLVRPILHQTPAFDDNATATRLTFACAFICSGTCDGFLFAIVIIKNHSVQPHSIHPSSEHVQVVWSANRDRPVKDGAVLTLSSNAGLVLTDADGSVAWSSALRGDGTVIGMLLNPQGCLVIFDHFQLGLWGSFHYPTDTLLPWQRLVPEQRLTANASPSNWSRGQLYLSFDSQGISAYVQSDPPTRYYLRGPSAMVLGPSEEQPIYQRTYMQYIHGSLELIYYPGINSSIPLRFSYAEQFVRLDSDGHFRAYEYNPNLGWITVEDLLFDELNNCDYPTACGRYGICTNGRCSCPQGGDDEPTYFAPVDGDPRLGCAATTPLTCQDSQRHHLMALGRVSYFGFADTKLSGVEIEACKSACSSNCSCKAAILRYESNASSGSCLLLDEVFSLRTPAEKDTYNYTAFLKVQLPVPSKKDGGLLPRRLARLTIVSLGSVGAIAFIILVIIVGVRIWLSRGKPQEKMDVVAADADSIEESHGQFEQVLDLELPTRFVYENLITATSNFSMQLGIGGSGSVFQGTLADGKRVAVKRIERILQGKKQFLAEVETISGIHHVNLVRLIGFCIERSYYLLVYEYMSNGSLDRWIFHEDKDLTLDWKTRHGIILGVAKGLAYLHEECRQRILHLDIKPQNILLDENFTAKIADFGLAKLVNKDQSKVMTVMRGTMGYMAPEWLNSVITEKADVYSFGVAVMEIVCGRKNLDYGQPMEDIYLVKALKEKAQESRLEDLINKEDEDMHLHVDEAVKMLRIAMWCLQLDFNLRPAMSRVVKVLEDGVDLDPAIDYQFIVPSTLSLTDKVSNPIFNSILSGPR